MFSDEGGGGSSNPPPNYKGAPGFFAIEISS